MLKFYLLNEINFNAEFLTFMKFLFNPRVCKYVFKISFLQPPGLNPGKAEMAEVIQV